MSSNDHGITVTIKYGKAYDDTWAVFKGSNAQEVRMQLLEYFDIDWTTVGELSLHELVNDVTKVAHGTATATRVLDAVAIPDTRNGQTSAPTENPWANLPDEFTPENVREEETIKEEKPFAHVYELFAQATDRKALQRVYVTNQDAFSDEGVIAAYKARGKELS